MYNYIKINITIVTDDTWYQNDFVQIKTSDSTIWNNTYDTRNVTYKLM